MQRFNIQDAPPMPQNIGLRAEPRHRTTQDAPHSGQTSPVRATESGLLRSTLKAGAAAIAILVLFVLPGEYGIDPTRVGRLLGLTEMGEIKQQLAAEAAADDAAVSAAIAPAASDLQIGARLDAIEISLGEIAAMLEAGAGSRAEVGVASVTVTEAGAASPPTLAVTDTARPPTASQKPAAAAEAGWRDEAKTTLAPGEGIEIKLAMQEGEVARFAWSANGGVLNHDTHGDGSGQKVTYAQGRGVSDETGELTAAFTGNHGWFWRNRTDAPVTLTLQVGGAYSRFITP